MSAQIPIKTSSSFSVKNTTNSKSSTPIKPVHTDEIPLLDSPPTEFEHVRKQGCNILIKTEDFIRPDFYLRLNFCPSARNFNKNKLS